MSEDKNNFFRELRALNESTYEHIDMDRLVLYAVAQLEKNGIDPTYEKVVIAAFKMFPKKFSLPGFPEHPDGKRIHDCLWHCTYKTKKWLWGGAKSGYSLTERGKYVLPEVEKMLTGKIKLPTALAIKPRRKEDFFIKQLRKTDAYNKFINGKSKEISEVEIKEALRGEINTPKEVIRKNLEKYMEFANRMEASDVKKFLHILSEMLKGGGNT